MSEIATIKEMKEEAIRRMKMMNILPATIKQFKDEDIITNSEYAGMLYWSDDEQMKIIKQFENKTGNKVFHCILSNTNYGLMYTMLYVGKEKEYWSYDNDNIKNGMHMAYCMTDYDMITADMGSIGFKSEIGGLVRTW